ncbi:MAG: hypothetical protein F6J86_35085 [Symploca sp. SIO1B1]|nr:hypothetical protein [Symploca sp. SIO1A3]NER98992.1 hypothetical protein [Symploca sp. SIO1B1]
MENPTLMRPHLAVKYIPSGDCNVNRKRGNEEMLFKSLTNNVGTPTGYKKQPQAKPQKDAKHNGREMLIFILSGLMVLLSTFGWNPSAAVAEEFCCGASQPIDFLGDNCYTFNDNLDGISLKAISTEQFYDYVTITIDGDYSNLKNQEIQLGDEVGKPISGEIELVSLYKRNSEEGQLQVECLKEGGVVPCICEPTY